MPMDVMPERLGPLEHDKKRGCVQKVTKKYYYNFLGLDRLFERGDSRFTITSSKKWDYRFFGVTKEGVPIWGQKWRQYRYIGSDICGPVLPENKNEVFQNDKTCKNEEVSSFTNWNRGGKRLAFIYLGIFWTLEDGENLNDAAKRFIYSHEEVKRIFRRRRRKNKDYWIGEDKIYLYEIFRDGALIFNNGKAVLESKHHFFDSNSGLWAIMAAEGFFAREDVQELSVGEDFFDWYKTEVLKED